ncbi:MAG: hypothetical protein ACI83W_001597 [Marinoscillum sp.]|jgi:hypothetical protein
MLVVFAIYQFTYSYGARLAGEILRDLAADQSQGSYALDFEKIELSFLRQELHLTNVTLLPNETSEDTLDVRYQVNVPDFKIKLLSILNLYKREVQFKDITVTNPSILIDRIARSGEKQSFSFEAGDLYQLVDSYLIKFSIDSLAITQGKIEYQSKLDDSGFSLLLDQIEFNLKNFRLDENSSKQFLFSEGINLRLTNQLFLLADSSHILSFDEFSLNTATQDIFFENLKLKPRFKRSNLDEAINQYDMDFPHIGLRGIDFMNAYAKNELNLTAVNINNPKINLEQHVTSQSNMRSNDLALMIHNVFSKVSIEELNVNNATTSIKQYQGERDAAYHFDKTNIKIHDFLLDSTYFDLATRKELFHSIELQSENNAIRLADSSHLILIRKVEFATNDSSVIINDLNIMPLKEDSDVIIKSTFNTIAIYGMDQKRFVRDGDLIIKSIELSEPLIDLKFSLKPNKDDKTNFLKSIAIDEIICPKGNLIILQGKHEIKFANFFLELKDINWKEGQKFNLDQSVAIRNFNTTQLNISNDDIQIDIDKVVTQRNGRKISMNNLNINLKNQPYPIKAESIQLNGFNASAFLVNNSIVFDSLKVIAPELKLITKTSQDSSFQDFLKLLDFIKIDIIDGNMTLFDEQQIAYSRLFNITTKLTEFALDTIENTIIINPEISIDSLWFHQKKMAHEIKLNGFKLTKSGSNIQVTKLALTPLGKKEKSQFNIVADQLTIDGLDFLKLINSREISFDKGAVKESKIKISLVKNPDSTSQDLSLAFNHFTLGSSLLDFTSANGNLKFITQVELQLDQFDNKMTSPLKAEQYLVGLKNLSIQTSQIEDPIFIQSAKMDTKLGDYTFEKIKIHRANDFDLDIPSLSLTHFDIESLITNKEFLIDSLLVQQPRITYIINEDTTTRSTKLEWLANIKNTQILNARVTLRKEDIGRGDSLYFENISFTADEFDFRSSDTFQLGTSLKDFSISGENFSYLLPEGYFAISTKKYAYQYLDKHISLERLKLEPQLNRGEFQRQMTYQTDWFDALVDKVDIDGFELDSLLLSQQLLIGKINIKNLFLDTHRDKRLPREEGIYKALPQTLIREIPIKLKIDTISFSNSFISHSEFSKEGSTPGVIFFRKLNGTISNITNHPDYIAKSSRMTFYAAGTLMSTGNLMIMSSFDYKDPLDKYTLRGSVGEMNLTELNRFLENTAYVQIRDGINKSISFSFDGNEDYAYGKMKFYYNDLKINVLDADTHLQRGHGVSIKSFFANTFVVNSKNPRLLFVREGDIFTERDKEKSIFAYWGKAVVSGLVSSIGAKNNKKEIRDMAKSLKEQLDETE